MFYKKAQTATEYMIILAVVIIIALIVVGVLGGIPGVGGGARSRAAAAYWQTADIAIVSYSVKATDNMTTLNIRNNLRDTITVDDVKLSLSGSTDPTVSFSQASVVLAPGETKRFNDTVDLCNTAGDSFTSNVAITYTDDETGAVYVFTGEGNKLEGTCAQ